VSYPSIFAIVGYVIAAQIIVSATGSGESLAVMGVIPVAMWSAWLESQGR